MTDTLPADRLHPSSWLFHSLRALREIALPALIFVMVGRKDAFVPLVIGAVVAIASIAWGLVHSRTFRYELLDRELLVREGILIRETRHVPFTRIQAVNERQGPLHSLLGVTELVLESGSAGKPEAVMRVLGVAEAARIAAVLRSAAASTDAASTEVPTTDPTQMRELLRVPTDELVLHGIISNRGLVVIALAVGVVSQNTDLLELLPIDFERLAKDGADTAAGIGVAAMAGALLVLLLGFLVFVRLLSVAYAILTLHDFTLRRSGDRLRVNRGLLSRVDLSGRVSGFQRIVLHQSVLHRVFRRFALGVDLAGSSLVDGQGEPVSTRLDTLAPIATQAQAQTLLDEFLPGIRLEALDWRPLHRSAALRRWQRTSCALLPLLAVGVTAAWLLPDAPMTSLIAALTLAVAALAASAWHAHRWARWSAYATSEGVVVFRSGVWARCWTLVFDDRAQSMTLRRSPRDRREGTASLLVDVQSMTTGHALRIPYLGDADAARLNGMFWSAGAQGSSRFG